MSGGRYGLSTSALRIAGRLFHRADFQISISGSGRAGLRDAMRTTNSSVSRGFLSTSRITSGLEAIVEEANPIQLAAGWRERMAAADIRATQAETEARIGELAATANRAARLTTLYRGTLIPQTRIAAASALASYRTGGVDFEAVITGQLAVVRSELEVVRLAADRAQALAELEYLTALNGDSR